ncbi:hypothetical protein SAMN05216257_102110 [Meinhardsimonia xiamenensis]|jgi:hypothetical protein|uniref:Uncharacterized protein n=1 Tax=Meinhardsimonia xiamenensis TaxID=990712 RepID=A0A1G9AGD7_9RHOB|nr:hypothetical protein [Meinhardsimonia xiamenensis]PRX35411.1 hypothetical protein LV81_02009 [Meinhardsimonia xiamenensis]SDK25864.1 hypothetical protein SAMN05216257_102110 [Meinhardsimonia xiamenensis]
MYIDREMPVVTPVSPSWSEGEIKAVAPGTRVLTLQGPKPVETLAPGEHIVTRAGARRLRALAAGDGGFHLVFT